MKIETLCFPSFSIRYFRFGNPEGQPLMIIPGVSVKSVMESADFIEKQYQLFSESYSVYVIDRRENISGSYDIGDMADDTVCAMEKLSIRNADIYGVSQGGMIAQVIAVKRPDLVRKLILCSTAASISQFSAEVISEWYRLARNHDILGLMQSFAENIYTEKYCEEYRSAFIEFGRTVSDDDLERFKACISCIEAFDMRQGLHSIQAPVLILGGKLDKLFTLKDQEEIAKRTKSTVYFYENEAHGVYDENPDVPVRIKAFLEGSDAGK